ncbi:MAG: PepSY-associated TM helix domain-containing protein [Asticcacaulis sp.]|uniref:PepSY-associated TM helix domain-containing protein n=1 Tax=Asticcacaulis sp. TaxID=1872648 RepID=UPI0039E2B2EC
MATPVTPRTWHRILGSVIAIFLLYFGITGTIVQAVDLRALLTHAPATDPDIKAIRESIDGTANFSVIEAVDYDAAVLPQMLDRRTALATTLKAARSVVPSAPLKFVELRMIDGKSVGQVMAGDTLLRFDATTGARLTVPATPERHGPEPSNHRSAKQWHRLQGLTDWALWFNALVGIVLGVMIVTGLVLYFHLYQARAKLGRNGLFWSAGSVWKTLHRGVALVAAVFLSVVAVSGTLLSIDSFALQIYRAWPGADLIHGFPAGMSRDLSSPLTYEALPHMLETTLSATGNRPIRLIRLRTFEGTPQGVVITGGNARQLVFNAQTGTPASATGPTTIYTGFPFGWREHELMKQIHRGDILGLPGRFMDLFAGLSLIFLSATGLWMYLDLWKRRRPQGRKSIFWR